MNGWRVSSPWTSQQQRNGPKELTVSNELLEQIETVLPTLEEIREEIIQTAVTKSNRAALDQAYSSVVSSIRNLSAIASATRSNAHAQ